jgi:hypothetical protein
LDERFDDAYAPSVAAVFLRLLEAAEFAQGFAASFVACKAGGDLVAGFLLEVILEFVT